MASLPQGRTAAAQCGLFTHKSVPVIFEPRCINMLTKIHHKMLPDLTGTRKSQELKIIYNISAIHRETFKRSLYSASRSKVICMTGRNIKL